MAEINELVENGYANIYDVEELGLTGFAGDFTVVYNGEGYLRTEVMMYMDTDQMTGCIIAIPLQDSSLYYMDGNEAYLEFISEEMGDIGIEPGIWNIIKSNGEGMEILPYNGGSPYLSSDLDDGGIKFESYAKKLIANLNETVEGNIGKEVKIPGSDITWIVLYDEGEKTEGAQIIATKQVDFDDNRIDYWENKIGTDGDTCNASHMYLYNHVIEVANDLCAYSYGSLAKVADVRAAGTNPSNKTATGGAYTLPSGWLSGTDYSNCHYVAGDNNFEYDMNRIESLSKMYTTLGTGNEYDILYASRHIEEDISNDRIRFYINNERTYPIFSVSSSNYISDIDIAFGSSWVENFRPVLILEPGALSSATEDEYGVLTISNN